MAQGVKSKTGEAQSRSTPLAIKQAGDWQTYAFMGLAVAGLLISAYLSWTRLTASPIACTADGGCDLVNESAYAKFPPNWGIPVAFLGLVGYLGLLVLSVLRWRLAGPQAERNRGRLDLMLFGASLVGVVFSAYLTAMELWVIKAICWWCVGSAVVMTGLFVLALVRVWQVD